MSELTFDLGQAALTHVSIQKDLPEVQRRHARLRVLLALDGQSLTPDTQHVALRCCLHWTRRLDILLVNPPQAPTFLLGGLLLRLEHSGIDYRLDSREGDYCEEVTRYLQRHTGIGLVIVNALPALEHYVSTQRPELGRKAARFISLVEPDRLRQLGETA